MQVRVLGLDPGWSTGWFLSQGYEPLAWGSERAADRILQACGQVDVVVYEDALDLDRVQVLRRYLHVPWVGVRPEQLQRRLFSRVLGRKQVQGPLARREVVRRAFGNTVADVHALDAACLVAWWLAGSDLTAEGPAGGSLRVWDLFTIADEFGEQAYQVVPPNTADPGAGLVSWASPLVQALQQAQPGQRVTVRAPGGDWDCLLVRIEPRE